MTVNELARGAGVTPGKVRYWPAMGAVDGRAMVLASTRAHDAELWQSVALLIQAESLDGVDWAGWLECARPACRR